MTPLTAFWAGVVVGSLVTAFCIWYFHNRQKANTILTKAADDAKAAVQEAKDKV